VRQLEARDAGRDSLHAVTRFDDDGEGLRFDDLTIFFIIASNALEPRLAWLRPCARFIYCFGGCCRSNTWPNNL
jgi:hypothetical protein